MWHGCTAIDGKYPNRSGTMDGLAYLMNLAADLGFINFKVEWSASFASKYPYDTWGSPTTLKQLAQAAPMAAALADVRFSRYQISVFSLVQPSDNPWAGAWTSTVGDAIEQEFYDVCDHLLATYSNKEFILSNWEGDWQLLNSFDPTRGIPFTRVQAYRDWHRRRKRAMVRARANNPGSTSALRYAVECNRVLDGDGYRVHRDIVANVNPDVVSLSPYEAIEGWAHGITDQAALEADIETKLTEVVARIRAELPNVAIVIGEYGWPQEASYFAPIGLDVGALFHKVITVATSLGVEGEIVWQITDNEEESPGQPRGFHLYYRNGSSTTVGALSPAGTFYQALLA